MQYNMYMICIATMVSLPVSKTYNWILDYAQVNTQVLLIVFVFNTVDSPTCSEVEFMQLVFSDELGRKASQLCHMRWRPQSTERWSIMHKHSPVSMWPLQAQIYERGCCLHAHLAAPVSKHSLVHLGFAYIYIRLFWMCSQKAFMLANGTIQKHKHESTSIHSCCISCCWTPIYDWKFPATATEQIA